MATKKLYFKIGEACKKLDIQPYVLRYWETEFPALSPNKSKSGQRVYTADDLQVIGRIKELLYEEGFTIAGAKKKLLDEKDAIRDQLEFSFNDVDRAALLLEIRRELRGLLQDLRGEAPR